ncbi:hypothetical protein FRACYDRAFT_268639, partial [Fragilariopsis cylindrus CCMP1102]
MKIILPSIVISVALTATTTAAYSTFGSTYVVTESSGVTATTMRYLKSGKDSRNVSKDSNISKLGKSDKQSRKFIIDPQDEIDDDDDDDDGIDILLPHFYMPPMSPSSHPVTLGTSSPTTSMTEQFHETLAPKSVKSKSTRKKDVGSEPKSMKSKSKSMKKETSSPTTSATEHFHKTLEPKSTRSKSTKKNDVDSKPKSMKSKSKSATKDEDEPKSLKSKSKSKLTKDDIEPRSKSKSVKSKDEKSENGLSKKSKKS